MESNNIIRGMIWTFVFTIPSPTCSVSSSPENNSIQVIMQRATVEMTEITISVVNHPWKEMKDLTRQILFCPVAKFFRFVNSFLCNLQDVKARLRLEMITDATVKGTVIDQKWIRFRKLSWSSVKMLRNLSLNYSFLTYIVEIFFCLSSCY